MSAMPHAQRASILVVENERIVAFNIQQRLIRLGYDVPAIAASGEEVLRKIQAIAPDIVLMDIRIDGELDGIETASRLAGVYPVPVVYLTAHAELPTLERAKATRPYGYLIKPFSELELHATLQMALERRSGDLKLQASEARYRNALENMLEGCQLVDFDWRYRYLNDSVLQHGRRGRDEWLGRTVMEVFPGIENTELFAHMQQCMLHRVPQRLQTSHQYEDGSVAWFDLRIQPVPEGIFILSIDITRQKMAEAELAQLNEHLENRISERTAELEEAFSELEAFSYSVSHDLRVPLRHANAFAQLALDENGAVSPRTRTYLEKIITATVRMGHLIDDLLTFSRAGRVDLNLQPVNLNDLVAGLVQEHARETSERGIRWKIDALPDVLGDAALLRQVFVNLLGNALKFTRDREHSSIEIFAEIRDVDIAEICVRDNGAGFDMRYVDKLFGVFQRLHGESEFEGTGIGLAIVRRIIERHGGATWAVGELGKGAAFYVTLKRCPRLLH